MRCSRLPLFYKKTPDERLSILCQFFGLTQNDLECLRLHEGTSLSFADNMVENVITTVPMPLGVATNFFINNNDYVIPMATEEASVIAAACYAAKLARVTGGFQVHSSPPVMVGQIQLVNVQDSLQARDTILKNQEKLLALANACDSILIERGGGAFGFEFKELQTLRGTMLIVSLLVNVCDAMGSNIVNTMVEAIAPYISHLTQLSTCLRIVSNGSGKRLVKATAVWKRDTLGDAVIQGFLDADAFAHADVGRAATHNKGIMNGIDAVAIATGNDFRALEAAAHSYAARDGVYKPLTKYYCNVAGDLVGELEMPLPVGIVGGGIASQPVAQVALKILKVTTGEQLAHVMGAVGLAQNFAALRALVSEGIQLGHMRLHSKNIASNAGAHEHEVILVAEHMVSEKNITVQRAQELLLLLSKGLLCK